MKVGFRILLHSLFWIWLSFSFILVLNEGVSWIAAPLLVAFVIYVGVFVLPRKDVEENKELRYKANRLREINSKKAPTMEEVNEKRILVGYPHLLEIVKEKCPSCKGKMWHDNFHKLWDYSGGSSDLKACYNCSDCKKRFLFSLFTNKFDKEEFAKSQDGGKK